MLKESDLFVKHGYVSNNVNFAHGVLSKRVIVSIDRKKGKVIYWDVKGVKGGVKAEIGRLQILLARKRNEIMPLSGLP